MKSKSLLVLTLVAATALSPVAYAASQMEKQDTAAATTQSTDANDPAMKDFAKLSNDGFQAFRNVQMARLAIFDGRTDEAKTLLDQAQASLKTAKGDGTAFEKAEADMKQPNAKTQKTADASDTKADKSEVKTWLPIDGQIILGEDYTVTPENNAAIGKANVALKAGDKAGAVEQLKLAGIDMSFATALVPLDQATQDVNQAVKDVDAGKYYEANLDLKKVQDGVVVDVVDVVGTPQATKDKTASATTGDQAKTATHQASTQTGKEATTQKTN